MALLSSCLAGEVAFRLLFSPLGSKALARSACIIGGLAIPAYSSFKAIELKDMAEQEQWLLYWTAYGCLSAGEIFSDKLLSWLPGYYHAKLAFLMWLQLPFRNGSRQILSTYLRPTLLRYQSMLDGIVYSARNDINNFLVAYLQELKFIKAVARKLAQYSLPLPKMLADDLRSTLTRPSTMQSIDKLDLTCPIVDIAWGTKFTKVFFSKFRG